MKKSLIIVIVLAVVILGAFILLKPQTNPQSAVNQALGRAAEASLKTFVAIAMSDIAQYYSDKKNTTPYWIDATNKQALDARFAQVVKSKFEGDFAYNVLDEKENAAVKAADKSRSIYVCMDSLTAKVTNITAEEFSKNTDCSGQVIK